VRIDHLLFEMFTEHGFPPALRGVGRSGRFDAASPNFRTPPIARPSESLNEPEPVLGRRLSFGAYILQLDALGDRRLSPWRAGQPLTFFSRPAGKDIIISGDRGVVAPPAT
jgi:hypothetical protein